MQSWLAQKVVSYTMRRAREGDLRPTLRMDHPQVRLTFPGRNSWSGVFRGKAEVEQWLHRFAEVGVKTFPDEVVVKGMPWNTTICVRGHDHVENARGERVYENRFVIWGHLVWGRLRDYEVYEDTHEPETLDAYLREHRPDLITA